jgi:hypothetical protein
MANHGPDLLPGTPVVFGAILENQLKRLSLGPEFTGSLIKLDYLGLLNTALNNHPGTRHVAIISGSSKVGRLIEGEIRKAYAPYVDRYDFIYLGHLGIKIRVQRARLWSTPQG